VTKGDIVAVLTRYGFETELRCSIKCWFKSKDLSLSGLPTEALVELARIARERGVLLEIKCGLSSDSMIEVATRVVRTVLLDISD
jgi:predicted amidohydrolase